MIKEMSIDLETYSDVDISKCGAYKYAESDNFEILLFGVSIDGGEVQVFDLACGDTIPDDILLYTIYYREISAYIAIQITVPNYTPNLSCKIFLNMHKNGEWIHPY